MDGYQGITTEQVSSTVFSGMRFPCLLLDKGLQITKSSAKIIRNLVTPRVPQSADLESSGTPESDIAVYLVGDEGSLKLIGMVSSVGYGSLLEILPNKHLTAYLDKNTKLVDDKLLVLR